jgi:hypothetical protein
MFVLVEVSLARCGIVMDASLRSSSCLHVRSIHQMIDSELWCYPSGVRWGDVSSCHYYFSLITTALFHCIVVRDGDKTVSVIFLLPYERDDDDVVMMMMR